MYGLSWHFVEPPYDAPSHYHNGISWYIHSHLTEHVLHPWTPDFFSAGQKGLLTTTIARLVLRTLREKGRIRRVLRIYARGHLTVLKHLIWYKHGFRSTTIPAVKIKTQQSNNNNVGSLVGALGVFLQ
jgi:hypothetical protein